jgi:hypothetical protein
MDLQLADPPADIDAAAAAGDAGGALRAAVEPAPRGRLNVFFIGLL